MSENEEQDRFSELLYPFLVEEKGVSKAGVLAEVRGSTLQKCREVVELRRQVRERYTNELIACAQAMAAAFRQGGKLLVFGNGGSATDAQDISADFMHPPTDLRFTTARPTGVDFGLEAMDKSKIENPKSKIPLPALSLTNDIAVVTAVGNDVGFANVFARQIIAFGQSGDMALGVSTSGSSSNVLVALEQAKKQGLLTVGLSGYDGGKMARMALDFCFTVPSTYIPRIQEAQATIYHTVWELIHHILEKERE